MSTSPRSPRTGASAHLLTAALSAAIGGVIGFLMQSGPPVPDPSRDASLAAVERSLAELSQKVDEWRARQNAPAASGAVVAPTSPARTEDPTTAETRLATAADRIEQLVRDLATSGSVFTAERLRAARARKPVADLAAVTDLHARFVEDDEERNAALQREWMMRDMADVLDQLGSPTRLENQLGNGSLGWTYELTDGASVSVYFRDGLVTMVEARGG
ncbi:MAG: hypothetical protein R3F29_08485 [Planctomycetota bacterium]